MERVAFDIGDAFFGEDHFLKELTGVGTLASVLLSNAIMVAGIVLIFLIVFAGIQIITGSGDPQKIDRARQIITAGVIGFILVVAAFFIVRLVEGSLGISILG
jgi:hypothetical protein